MSARKTRVFQPFQKVWTPRTPDSGYDSMGLPPPPPILNAPLLTEAIGLAINFQTGQFERLNVQSSAAASSGFGITFQSGSYTPAS
jgi:hypothetical protein